jgi:hypothetical protein
LDLDGIADLYDRRVEDRLAAIPAAGEGDGIAAGEYGKRRDGVERGQRRFELMAITGDARRETCQRIARSAQSQAKRTGARFDQAVERDSPTVQPLALHSNAPRKQAQTVG